LFYWPLGAALLLSFLLALLSIPWSLLFGLDSRAREEELSQELH